MQGRDHVQSGARKSRMTVGMGYGVAAAGVAAGAAIRWLMFHHVGPGNPFLPFLPAVAAAAVLGGAGAGLLATALGAVAAAYWVEPVGSFRISSPADLLRLGVFVLVSGGVVQAARAFRRMQSRADAAAAQSARADRQLAAVLENITDGFVALDREWRCTYVNAVGAQMARRTRDEMLGRNVWEFFPDVVGTNTDRQLRRALGENTAVRFEAYYRTFDNWTEFHAYPSESGIAVFVQDITERKRAEQALRASEERFRLATEAVTGLVYDWDAVGGRIFRSKGIVPLLGYTPEEAEATPDWWMRRVHPEDAEVVRRALASDGNSFDIEYRVRHRDGQYVHCWDKAVLVRDGNGNLLRVVGSTIDVTEWKRATQALRESEAFYRSLGEAVPDFIWSCDPAARYEYVNGRFLEYLGVTLEELNADGRAPAHLHHPEERDGIEAIWAHVNRRREPYQVEYRLRRKDGAYRWFIARGVPMKDGEGRVIKWVGTATDIDDRKRVEDALAKAKREADAANASKDQFLAVLSHELRTPLTPVLATVAELATRRSLPEEVRSELAMVRRNVELEARLIDDLLDLTRISKGKLRLELRPTDTHAVLRQALGICEPEVRAKRLHVACDWRASRRFVLADDTRLRQVFWNVLKNAVKFTPEGGSVVVETWDEYHESDLGMDSHSVVVRVTDTGIGIEEALLPKVFEAFEQGDPALTRRFGGLGLGLAITKALVEAHGGTIGVESAGRDQGAAFTLRLPTVRAPQAEQLPEPAATAPAPEAVTAPAPAGPGGRMTVLLVEDHPDTARVMSRLLREFNFDVKTATCVREALESAASNPFQLVISDIGLPDGSGVDLMRELRDLYNLPGIALSGFGMDDDLRKSKEAGFAEHLTKPIDIHQLLGAIERTTGHAAGTVAHPA